MRPTSHKNKLPGQSSREIHATERKLHAAFTMVELLVVIALLAVLAGMLIPVRSHEAKAPRIRCVNNLKNVGLAVRIFSTDNNDRFPWQLSNPNDPQASTNILYTSDPITYLLTISNELSTPLILKCPGDTRKATTNWTQFTRENLSYFISPDASETYPQSFLAGDRNITNKNGRFTPGLHALSPMAEVGWDETIHKNQGNACMGDGSVQQLSTARLRDQLRHTGQTNQTIKFAFP